MIVPIDPIALYKVIPNFTDEFLRVNILARPRNVPNRWNSGYADYFWWYSDDDDDDDDDVFILILFLFYLER